MWKLRVLLAVAMLLIYCQSPAVAQPPCMPAEAGLAFVQGEYGENPLFEGQMASPSGAVTGRFVLTWNAQTGTWSLLVAHPAQPGSLCMVGNGEDGKPAGTATKAPGAPS